METVTKKGLHFDGTITLGSVITTCVVVVGVIVGYVQAIALGNENAKALATNLPKIEALERSQLTLSATLNNLVAVGSKIESLQNGHSDLSARVTNAERRIVRLDSVDQALGEIGGRLQGIDRAVNELARQIREERKTRP